MMAGVVYDAGALIAAERNSRWMWALHKAALADHVVPVVPAPALAQVWRGGATQASLGRLLRGCDIAGFPSEDAKSVGVILAKAGTSDVVDAHVLLIALRREAVIVTSDPNDIGHLNDAMGAKLAVKTI